MFTECLISILPWLQGEGFHWKFFLFPVRFWVEETIWWFVPGYIDSSKPSRGWLYRDTSPSGCGGASWSEQSNPLKRIHILYTLPVYYSSHCSYCSKFLSVWDTCHIGPSGFVLDALGGVDTLWEQAVGSNLLWPSWELIHFLSLGPCGVDVTLGLIERAFERDFVFPLSSNYTAWFHPQCKIGGKIGFPNIS